MKIKDIIDRAPGLNPAETLPIPWADPEFSARMLKNHLSQDHDWASRRQDYIERQADWLARRLPPRGRLLDLACGPGFYTQILARRGFSCVGVDISPASVAYAQAQADREALPARYILGDVRTFTDPEPFDGVMMVFGEFNEFSPEDARRILAGCFALLAPGGFLLLEEHTFEAVRDSGLAPASWWPAAENSGILSARPHLCLQENSWEEKGGRATLSYLIIDAETAEVRLFRSTMTGYSAAQLKSLTAEAGFKPPQRLSARDWPVGGPFEGLMAAYVCRK
jgi:SAM-dependent methyltransferase